MMYKVKVAVCSEIRTKHSTQSEHHVEFLNVTPGGTYKIPLGFKWLKYLYGKRFGSGHFRAKPFPV
jgi:hypothetical protein